MTLATHLKEKHDAAMSLATRLKESREALGISKAQAAQALEKGRETMTRYESGEREPTFRDICCLAALYKTPLSQLLNLPDKTKKVVTFDNLYLLDHLGTRLRNFRERQQATREDVERSSGVSQAIIVKLESGAARPDWRNLVALSREYNVTLHHLVFGL